jgi:hypothetical protein
VRPAPGLGQEPAAGSSGTPPRPVLPVARAVRLLPRWVERDLPLPRPHEAAARELDRSLRALARAGTHVDLRLGDGLRLFQSRFSPLSVCERGLGDLAVNRLGFSPSQASELMSVARGAARFPVLEEALLSGRIPRSQARELLAVMKEDTAAGWVRWASGRGVRETREVVRAYVRREGGGHVEDEGDGYEAVRIRVSAQTKALWELGAREMVERLEGGPVPGWKVLDDLCAEAWSLDPGLGEPLVEDRGPVRLEAREEGNPIEVPADEELRRWGAKGADVRSGEGEAGEGRPGEGGAEERVLDGPEREVLVLLSQPPDPGEAGDAWGLLQCLKVLTLTRQSLSWQIGRALSCIWWESLSPDLGFACFADYLDRCPGLAEGRAGILRRLDRALQDRPPLRNAYRDGRLGWNKAWLVVRATRVRPGKSGDWVEHARRVSFRRLQAEVRALEALREHSERTWWERTRGLPPSPELLRELEVLPGGFKPASLDALDRIAGAHADVRRPEGSRGAHLPLFARSWIAFRAPPEVHAFYRRVVSGLRRRIRTDRLFLSEETCVRILIEHFAETWLHLPLCGRHHRPIVHGGRARVEGPAPDGLVFRVGRREDGGWREVWHDDERLDREPDPVLEWEE